jgi:choline dehydrogenase
MDWDIIIVGGGSAGCVMAHRLSANPHLHVLLIEAGESVQDPDVAAPPAWPSLMGGAYDWKYQSAPQAGLHSRQLAQPRGKGLGGSSLINALGFQRGPAGAYDRWARETGDEGWSYKGLLPYFKRLETASCGETAYRGGSGPLHILALQAGPDRNPLASASHQAALHCGYAENPDWNAADAEGAIWAQYTISGGLRHDCAAAYLRPVAGRPNLHIMTGTQVLRLVFENRRCIGVEAAQRGGRVLLRAREETILSAGAVDSPRLLLLSGIGPAAELARLGLPVVADLPGVGRNLHDHPLLPGLLFQARRKVPPSAFNHCETMALGRTSLAPGWADMQLMTLSVPFLSPALGTPPAGCFSIVPALLYPRSRGSLTLQDADPRTPPCIDPGYLTAPDDLASLVEGMDIARSLAAAPPLRAWIASEVFPGPSLTKKQDMAAYLRQVASPFFHPVSTCAMGPESDPQAVVTPDCRLRSVSNVRVADASIFPSIPQAMTHAAVLAVAERAADLVMP